ncbi:hypothetical protein L1987_61764 [Smallanthus sonchifolius]|uniref:Uncharacterized protein n=1 Tax=Smallanthus sonchifolius TaxID=185202 RepID=A0ACB9C8T8_9ASTR|nr:hypothetical protein L1987_61764 [Smallanthus sonchifolius]
MVISGKRRETAEEDMERLKPLHNFDLPYLKWGNQKLLRCMKVDSIADPNQSSPEKLNSRIGVAGDGEIEATREKLMFDFQKQVGEMKDAILREGLVDLPATATATTTTVFNSPAERPWNLRTRRAACKAPRSPSYGNGEVLKPNSSPVANECRDPNLRPAGSEKREREKFSVSLSRHELEEDFMAMAGRRLPRKPKKRPRIVQKQLDTLFPGLWLSEITADLYKVPDEAETGKR